MKFDNIERAQDVDSATIIKWGCGFLFLQEEMRERGARASVMHGAFRSKHWGLGFILWAG